ncbi:MAG: hypothetical protein IPJ50_16450 [Betaproteobacteria bacterium]|jgi:hypothetical protein|nr:hypothetical protein [Betaproteobacteria bacterium]MBK8317287.1 hypothetical protein [Betaproteobacteria bacterium]
MQTHCPAASRFTILDELRSHFPAVQSLLLLRPSDVLTVRPEFAGHGRGHAKKTSRLHRAESIMDRATTISAKALWTEEAMSLKRDLPRLTPDEEALYKDMRGKRLGKNLRLEQERIPFQQVAMALNWALGMAKAFIPMAQPITQALRPK